MALGGIWYNLPMTYTGSCHCGAVKFEVDTEIEKALECNCSHCHKKGFLLHFADKKGFKLLSGEEHLTEYHFNKKIIHHRFCKTCGVEGFADNDAYPQIAVNVRCLEGLDTDALPREKLNGRDY